MKKKIDHLLPKDQFSHRRSFTPWLFLGTLLSALLASACCWLPLLLLVLGLSTVGAAQALERFRPFLLGITFILLVIAFYLTYRPQRFRLAHSKGQNLLDCCSPPLQEESCCLPSVSSGKRRRIQRMVLWVVTGLVLAFAFSPAYVGRLMGSNKAVSTLQHTSSGVLVTFRVKGMTCAGCAAIIRRQLLRVPGVKGVDVDFKKGRVQVVFKDRRKVSCSVLAEAVKKAGYTPELSFSIKEQAPIERS